MARRLAMDWLDPGMARSHSSSGSSSVALSAAPSARASAARLPSASCPAENGHAQSSSSRSSSSSHRGEPVLLVGRQRRKLRDGSVQRSGHRRDYSHFASTRTSPATARTAMTHEESEDPDRIVGRQLAGQPGGDSRPGVLVSVTGLTPQVITETLYCLTQSRRPPVEIREIYVITTATGKALIERTLLDGRRGRFQQFCRDYGIDPRRIRFSPEQVLAIRDANGRPLQDIRSPEDSAAAADFILEFIRRHTRDASRVLHCSVAGGRKTLGLYLGLALQLYGRPGDTLSHVLVSPPELESAPEFYYPPRRHRWLQVKGRRLHTSRIKVELAEMPLLMLRGKLPALEAAGRSYTELVRRAQEEYALLSAPPLAVVEPRTLTLQVAGRRVRLSPLEMAIYFLFARARRQACEGSPCSGCRNCTLAATDFLGDEGVTRVRDALGGLRSKDARLEMLRGWRTTDPTDAEKRFREVRSRLNRKIQRGLGGEAWPTPYTICSIRVEGEDRLRYGLRLDPKLLNLR